MGLWPKRVASTITRFRDYLSWLDLFGLEPKKEGKMIPCPRGDTATERQVNEQTGRSDEAACPSIQAQSHQPQNEYFGPPRCRVLVIDDEESIRGLLKEKLTTEGREVLLASNGREGLKLFHRERPDITLLDLNMPGMGGLEVLQKIKAFDRHAVVMIFTGYQTEDAIQEARQLGVIDFLQKGESLPIAWDARRRPEGF